MKPILVTLIVIAVASLLALSPGCGHDEGSAVGAKITIVGAGS